MKKFMIASGIIISIMFAWHLWNYLELGARLKYVSSESGDFEIKINPITNYVSMRMYLPPTDTDNPYAAAGAALAQSYIQSIGPGIMERQLSAHVYENYDFYSMVVPYKVYLTIE